MIEAKGEFLPFPPPRNPGEFDVAGWLHRQGAWGVFEAQGLARSLAPPSVVHRLEARARAWFLRPQPYAAVLLAAFVFLPWPPHPTPSTPPRWRRSTI